MPRAKVGAPPKGYRPFSEVQAEYKRRNALLHAQLGDTVTFLNKAAILRGVVGSIRTDDAGYLQFFVYVDNPDGFGTTGHVVYEWDIQQGEQE